MITLSVPTTTQITFMTQHLAEQSTSPIAEQQVSAQEALAASKTHFCNLSASHSDFWKPATAHLQQTNSADLVATALFQHSHPSSKADLQGLQQLSCDLWNRLITPASQAPFAYLPTTAEKNCPTTHCQAPIAISSPGGPVSISEHSITIPGKDPYPVVSLPPRFSKSPAAWLTIGHEVGHCFAEPNGKGSIVKKLQNALQIDLQGHSYPLSLHHVSELTADAILVLQMGPVGALGLACFLKGMRVNQKLSTVPKDPADEHPADIVRVLFTAAVVERLCLTNSGKWSMALRNMAYQDFNQGEAGLSFGDLSSQTTKIAHAMLDASVLAGKQSLFTHHRWNEQDEQLVEYYLSVKLDPKKLADFTHTQQFKGAHLVVAATLSLLQNQHAWTDVEVNRIFDRMVKGLAIESFSQAPCKTCPLSQERIYTFCPTSSCSKNTYADSETDTDIRSKPNLWAIGGISLLALSVLSLAGFILFKEMQKSGKRGSLAAA